MAIPTYKRPEYLPGAIESALAQTYRNTEIIVSDSAGERSVEALVASFRDPRLRYRRNEGVTSGRENTMAVFRAARGEFIGTLHDDDLWEPTFLERLVPPLAIDPELVLAWSDHWLMDGDGTIDVEGTEANTRRWGRMGLSRGRHQPFAQLALGQRAVPFLMATVFRRDVLDWEEPVIPPQVGATYDLWLSYLFSRDGGAAWYEPERLTRYRSHESSATATERLEAGVVFCFDTAIADERLAELRPCLRRVSAPFRASHALNLLAAGNAREGRRAAIQAIRDGAVLPGSAGIAISCLPAAVRPGVIAGLRDARRRALRGRDAPRSVHQEETPGGREAEQREELHR